MIRFILIMAVVFVLPFVGWRIWAALKGVEPGPVPVGALSLAGAALAATAMVVLAALSIESSDRDGLYQPPRLEGGEVRPGRFEPSEPDPDPDQPSLER
jgi:hypothetical protein